MFMHLLKPGVTAGSVGPKECLSWTNLSPVNCNTFPSTPRTAVVHLNVRAGSTFSVPDCIAQTLGKWSRHSIGLAGATRLTRSDFRLNLLLLKGQGMRDTPEIEYEYYKSIFYLVSQDFPTTCSFGGETFIKYTMIKYDIKHNYKIQVEIFVFENLPR